MAQPERNEGNRESSESAIQQHFHHSGTADEAKVRPLLPEAREGPDLLYAALASMQGS